jgi:hypothetical protein
MMFEKRILCIGAAAGMAVDLQYWKKRPGKYESILNPVFLRRSYDLDEVADYWEGIIRINDSQKSTLF